MVATPPLQGPAALPLGLEAPNLFVNPAQSGWAVVQSGWAVVQSGWAVVQSG
jgi:hypothetical protein